MARRTKMQRMSHPVEVLREVYTLKTAERRLRGIVEGMRGADGRPTIHADPATRAALRDVLRDSLTTEANGLGEIAERLNRLLGPDAATLKGDGV